MASYLSFNSACLASSQGPMVVLVHGAHLTAKSWNRVEQKLNQNGIDSMAVNLPGRLDTINPKKITLSSSSQFLCKSITNIHKKIVFVTHSQGGAIVNHAQSICPNINVERIIYLASVSPLTNEKPFDSLSKADEESYFEGVSYEEKSGLMIISNEDAFVESFSSIANNPLKNSILAAAVNEPAYIADGVVSMDSKKYAAIKKFYIFTQQDKIISMDSQVKIAKQLKPIKTSTINSGHIPMITHPDELVSALIQFITI
jgi:pimeloyl-ACP methyl ester carboxylesterase